MFYRFEYNSEIKTSEYVGVSRMTTSEYKQRLIDLFAWIRVKEHIICGGENNPIEFDGLYYKPKYKPQAGARKSKLYRKNCLFRLIERAFTKKGRHKQISYVVREESVNDCLDIICRHVPDTKTPIMLDGCGIGRSTALNSIYENVQQCSHKRRQYVKPCSEMEDWASKVHDATAENSFKKFRADVTRYYGISLRKKYSDNHRALWNYIYESDFINNYTNNDARDYVQEIIFFMRKYYT